MLQEENFLGQGWGFPPTFDASGSLPGVVMVAGLEDIQQSLHILLTTRLNERLMAPDYGCDVQDFLFEPLDVSSETRLRDLVRTAILYNEPRITPLQVKAAESSEQPGLVLIEVEYEVNASNTRHNFVYPFYQQEGRDPGAGA